MGPKTAQFLQILDTLPEEAQARAIRILQEYAVNGRDLTDEECEEAAAMLANVVNQERRKE